MSITGTIGGWEGASAPVSSPFQVADCADLGFRPAVAVSTGAHASKTDGASLTFKISYPKGAGVPGMVEAGRSRDPQAAPLATQDDPAGMPGTTSNRTPRVPRAFEDRRSVVHTQVLPGPLEGPVYFVSYGDVKFPEVVMVLTGDNVTSGSPGKPDQDEVTSVTFPAIPDVPFETPK